MNAVKKARLRQIVYILMPLFFLLLGLGAVNGWMFWQARSVATPESTTEATAVTTPTNNLIASATTTMPPTATPTPLPTATPYIPPIFSPDVAITLLGPPQNSTFSAQDTAVFYWQWPLPLSDDQYFAVYAQTDDGEPQRLGTIVEPNLGTSYRLAVHLSDFSETAVNWHIRLETEKSDQPLISSDSRSFNLLP